ncbi:MAG: hypothetical protein II312_08540 [Lachnospiraceae bacterium]|nr:hypothetical protein [Lachnospiraceae bacterium]MEE0920104.1 hypothetical protein [Lachnospiraceae bacterium]
MDNFIDKLAQKFSAQDIIKANSEAETAEYEKLKLQVSEYEKILQEMRKLNYKNSELSEKIDTTIGDNAEKIQGIKEEELALITALKDITEEQVRNREQEMQDREEARLQREKEDQVRAEKDINAITELLDQKFQQSDDFVHKENVKVYRNVQAVVVDELKTLTEGMHEGNGQIMSIVNRVMIFSIISTLASLASLILWVLTALHIIK